MPDYHQFPKIDAHMHITVKDDCFIQCAIENNMHLISINTDAAVFPPMNEQEDVTRYFLEKFPDNFSYISSFSMKNRNSGKWYKSILDAIENSINYGAVGLKVWKNIGIEIRKEGGDFLMIDDDFFTDFFQFLIQKKIPLLTHIGEPKNCWLPIDEMTTKRNRDYYTKNPEFHMYHHPDYPSYEALISSRDNVLKMHPDLCLIGAHLGSVEWSIDELANRFELFPNFSVDLSSRINHLQLQSIQKYEEVRNFFIKYADRLLYGSDIIDDFSLTRTALKDKIQYAYHNDWLFFSSNQIMASNDFSGEFKGLNLPENTLKLIYYNNALHYYPRLKKRLSPIQ